MAWPGHPSGSGGESLDQTWASDYSWSHTPPPPGGGLAGGGLGGGGSGEPTGSSSSGGEAGAVADVPGYFGGQIDGLGAFFNHPAIGLDRRVIKHGLLPETIAPPVFGD